MDCLPGKIVEERPENSSYLTSPLRDPIREEAMLEHTTDANLTTTAEESA